MTMKFILSIELILFFNENAFACPFCNVDGVATRSFIFLGVGVMILGFAGLFFWALASGQFKGIEGPKHRMLELEKQSGVNLDGK